MIHTSRDGCLNLTIVSRVWTPFLKYLSEFLISWLALLNPDHFNDSDSAFSSFFFYIFVCSPNKNPGQFLPIRLLHLPQRKPVSEPRRLIIIRSSLKLLAKHPRIVGIDLGFESRIRLWAELKRLTSDLQLRYKHQTKLGFFTLSEKRPQLQSGLDGILWREMNDSGL